MDWSSLTSLWRVLKFSCSSVFFIMFFFMLFSLNVCAQGPPSVVNVNGFVFNSDLSGAPNGVVVRVWNVDLGQFFFTQVFAPPIPQLMGAYSLSINGSVGDLLIISAYNSSHYAETFLYVDNSTIKNDLILNKTRPKILLLSPNNFSSVAQGNVEFVYYLSDLSVDSCTFYFGNESLSSNATNSSPLLESNNSFSVFLYENIYFWNVLCNTTEGYSSFSDFDLFVNVSRPDLGILSSDIWFEYDALIESGPATVLVNITNTAPFDIVEYFFVDFFFGNPESGGVLLDSFLVPGLTINETVTLNKSFILVDAFNNIYVVVDSGFDVNETIESNNVANNSVYVGVYSVFYGSVNSRLVLGSSDTSLFNNFGSSNNFDGNVYVANSEASFSIYDLVPLGKDVNDFESSSDFSNLDSVLNMTGLPDSIEYLWTNNTDIPLFYHNFSTSFGDLFDVPVYFNSNSTFFTGILWDSADDSGNGFFDLSDKEDIVFITEINPNSVCSYGFCDYEVVVPARLSKYNGGSNFFNLYTELV